MRTLVKSIAFTLLILATINFTAFAGGGDKKGKKGKGKKDVQMPYKAAINKHAGNTVAVQFQKPSDDKVSITIKNADGKILKYETVRKHDLVVRKYVLDKFPAGKYTIIVANGSEVLTKDITVKGKPSN